MTRDVELFSDLIANERVIAQVPPRGSHIAWSWTAKWLEIVANLPENALVDRIEMMIELIEQSQTSLQSRLQDKVYGILGVLARDIIAQINPSVDAILQDIYRDLCTRVFQATGVFLVFSGNNVLARYSPT